MLKLLSGAIIMKPKDNCLKKAIPFPHSYMVWGCLSGKGLGEMPMITSTVHAHVYIETLETFLIPLIENRFGGGEVIY